SAPFPANGALALQLLPVELQVPVVVQHDLHRCGNAISDAAGVELRLMSVDERAPERSDRERRFENYTDRHRAGVLREPELVAVAVELVLEGDRRIAQGDAIDLEPGPRHGESR